MDQTDSEERLVQVAEELKQLDAEKKANDRRILELTEREIKHRELHAGEIHGLRKRNFEISYESIIRRNEMTRLKRSEPLG